MPDWPTSVWLPPDQDTPELRKLRNDAVAKVEKVLSSCQNASAVAVSGSGKSQKYSNDARSLGAKIAAERFNLLTGGLGGVMQDVMTGFSSAQVQGLSAIAILPAGKVQSVKAAIAVDTNLSGKDHTNHHTHVGPASRNHVLIYCASRVVCLPGTTGSIVEATLAKVVYNRPVVAYYDPQNMDEDVRNWKEVVQGLGIQLLTTLQEVSAWLKPY